MARITSKKLTDQTADRLFQMIISDPELCPGSKLPNETELCALFGVSRTTVRRRCVSWPLRAMWRYGGGWAPL